MPISNYIKEQVAQGSYVLFSNEFNIIILIHLIVINDISVLLCFEVAKVKEK